MHARLHRAVLRRPPNFAQGQQFHVAIFGNQPASIKAVERINRRR
jgi:hypothetical protein